MNGAPSFQFYAQDFLTGVVYLTNEETGIYIKMLAKQWTDGKIPIQRLEFLVGKAWVNLGFELRSKFEEKDGFLINLRLEKEREKSLIHREKQRENGKKGGRPNKKNISEPQQNKEKKPKPFFWVNPNESQKKPLEDEDEIEIEIEDEIKRGAGEKTKIAENVTMTDMEMAELIERFGKEQADWMVAKLNNYKISKGKKYKSDYRAILSWVVEEFNKQKQNHNGRPNDSPENKLGRQTESTIRKNLAGW